MLWTPISLDLKPSVNPPKLSWFLMLPNFGVKSRGDHTPLRFITTCDKILLPYIICHRYLFLIKMLILHRVLGFRVRNNIFGKKNPNHQIWLPFFTM